MLQNKTEAQLATKSAQDKAERIRNEGFQAAGKNDVDESFLKPMLKDAWGRVIAEQSPRADQHMSQYIKHLKYSHSKRAY
jgi:hypothetical protein